ncbi:MAG: class I SAM-dependent rRNA methyltransferase [Geobacteraceae bacterium]|nr:class I SAM-dependent rRNA methyltransferase [Geobacteraceae bacterium]
MAVEKRVLGAESVRMVQLGHPWIIADGFTKKWPSSKAGDLLELVDPDGRYVATALSDPAERVVARIISRKRVELDLSWIKGRLQRAISIRQSFIDPDATNAYRLVNGEGDYLPGLTVDCYGDYLMIQLYGNVWRPHMKLLLKGLDELLSPAGIYEKTRPQATRELEAVSNGKNYGRLLAGSPAPQKLDVRENGLTFLVSLEKGLDTGLFMDQRKNREALMKMASGKRVLNLFSYTGAFSVAAAVAGAAKVTSVDVSGAYMEWAKENFGANRLNPKRHDFVVADCFDALGGFLKEKRRFDIILMDPPSFSTTTKSRFTTRGGTSELVAAALPLLEENGIIICSSNHQKVDIADYLKELRRGALQAACGLQVLSLSGQPEDFPYPVTFPEGRYLKYALCSKRSEV